MLHNCLGPVPISFNSCTKKIRNKQERRNFRRGNEEIGKYLKAFKKYNKVKKIFILYRIIRQNRKSSQASNGKYKKMPTSTRY